MRDERHESAISPGCAHVTAALPSSVNTKSFTGTFTCTRPVESVKVPAPDPVQPPGRKRSIAWATSLNFPLSAKLALPAPTVPNVRTFGSGGGS